ncbi:hypothetical protein ACMFMF_003153 [Clarireedia jacksonii]
MYVGTVDSTVDSAVNLARDKEKDYGANLNLLTGIQRTKESETIIAPHLERTSSRRSVTTYETETTRSQRSSNATSTYRHRNLAAFEIHLHAEPPGHIQAAIDSILNQETSDDRRAEIHVISKEFRNSCLENVRAHSGEDDFIDPLHTAIKALGIKNLCIHQQAD